MFNIHPEDWFNFNLLQDLFLSRISKTITKTSKLSKKKKKGWFTKEAMQRTLNWSASLAPISKYWMLWLQIVLKTWWEEQWFGILTQCFFFKSLVLSKPQPFHEPRYVLIILGRTSRVRSSIARRRAMSGWWGIWLAYTTKSPSTGLRSTWKAL